MGEHTPWPAHRKRVVATGLFGVSTIALVVAAIGLRAQDEPSYSSAETASTQPAEALAPTPGTYVTPSVTYPTTIPGCDTVEPPSTELGTWTMFGGQNESYDDPRYPWFSGPKAVAMSDALRSAIPAGVEVEFVGDGLQFGPILAPAEPGGYVVEEPVPPNVADVAYGWTDASAQLTHGDAEGQLWVQVRQADNAPPACSAGALIERRHLADGTILDIQDTWSELDGNRTLSRVVAAYIPDGTRVRASIDDRRIMETDPAQRNSGTVPLTVEELVAVATTPGLRVSAPVPADTPRPAPDCSVGGNSDGRVLTRADADALNAVLNEYWRAHPMPGLPVDRPLGSLQLPTYGAPTGLCQTFEIGDNELSFAVITGQPLPHVPDVHDPDYADAPAIVATLADGSVVTADAPRMAIDMPSTGSGSPAYAIQSVTVTRPSGTEITVSSYGPNSGTQQQLRELASIPGLDLPR